MSKSLGNLYTLDDLKAKGHSPQAIRYALISGHYRQQLNFTFNGLNAANSALEKLEKETGKLLDAFNIKREKWSDYVKPPSPGFFDAQDTPFVSSWSALRSDINIPGALGALFSSMPFDANSIAETDRYLSALGAIYYALGIQLFTDAKTGPVEITQEITELAESRWTAKQEKDFDKSDKIRDELQNKGWNIKDDKDGYSLTPI